MRAAVAAVWLLICALAAPPAAARDASEQAFTATINGVSVGLIVFGLAQPSGFFMRAEDFDAVGLVRPQNGALELNGRAYLPLAATPGLKYVLDERALDLVIDCTAECFPPQVIIGLPPAPALSPVEPGVALDYEFNAERESGHVTFSGLAGFNVFTPRGRGEAGFLLQRAGDTTRAVRLGTTWTIDDPARRLSYRFGDSVTVGGAWGGVSRFAGVQVGTDLSLAPAFVPFVTPHISGAATLPSVLDIFVDNTLRATQEIKPGPFSILDLPVVTGRGEVKVVARDVLGREQVIVAPFYVSQRQLKPGLALWSLEAGALRRNYSFDSGNYGESFVSGTYRRGLTKGLTAEAHAEVSDRHLAGGLALSLRTWAPGALELVAAASREDGKVGSLGQVAYAITRGPVSLRIAEERASGDFRRLGEVRGGVRHLETRSAHASVALRNQGAVSAGYLRQRGGTAGPSEIVTATYSRNLGGWAHLHVSGLQDARSGEVAAALTLTVPLGERREAVAVLQRDSDGRLDPTFTAAQQSPSGGGLGGRVVVAPDARSQVNVWYDSPAGYGELDVARSATRAWGRGRLLYLGGTVRPVRAGKDAVVLVETPGFEGVGVLRDNRRVARTDRSGRVVVTGLRPYQENVIGVDPLDLPAGASIGDTQIVVTPRAESAARAVFRIEGGGGRLVVVRLPDGALIAPGATVTSLDSGEAFTAGYDGQVYIGGLTIGRRMRVQRPEGDCEFTVEPAPEGQTEVKPPILACVVP